MPYALILGGTGLVGRAVARSLLRHGWTVTVTGRDPSHVPADLTACGATFQPVDRDDGAAIAAAMGTGADLLVDCICYTGAQARLLIPVAAQASSLVMISSKAVYVDADGNHSNSEDPPRFSGPVTESQPTMAPGDMDYRSREGYGANKVAAEQTLLDSGLPVTVLRPSKIHGEGAAPAREWYFLKRALDGRPAVLLAARGAGGDHPTAAVNIAALVELAAGQPGARILNAADPDAPDGLHIARTVSAHAGHSWEEVLLDDDAPRELGRHPWHRLPPVVLDMTAAASLGYQPVGDYATTVAAELDWLATTPAGPLGTDHVTGWFDYAAEEDYLRSHPPGGGPAQPTGPP